MELNKIEEMLNLLERNELTTLKQMLLAEKQKGLKNHNQKELEMLQRNFENYMVRLVDSDNPIRPNLYGFMKGMLTFTNNISFFELNSGILMPIELAKKVLPSQISRFKEASEDKLTSISEQYSRLLGDSKLLVQFESKHLESQTISYESGTIIHSFSIKQTEYIEHFLGKNYRLYISEKNPVAYGESSKGKGYILGIKNRCQL